MMRRGFRLTLAALAVLLVSLVLGLLALRLLLPHWDGLAAQIEQRAGAALQRQVHLESLQIGWSGWAPELVARNVRVEGRDSAPLLAGELGVSLDPIRSLRARRPVLRAARLADVSLNITRDADGRWDVHGWRFGGRGTVAADWARQFAGMERLQITDGTLHWEDALTGVQTGLFVDRVGLHADAAGLRLAGRGSFLPEAGGPVYVGIQVPPTGPDPLELYLEAQDLQLPYWTRLTGWVQRGPQGTTSLRLWADMENGRVRRLQGDHHSRLILTAQDPPRVQEIGHRFRWRRDGARAESHWSAITPGAGDLRLEYHGSLPGQPPDRITVAAAGIDIRKFARPAAGLRLFDDRGFARLGEMDPHGALEQLYLVLEHGDRGWRVKLADAFLSGLSVDASGDLPAFGGLDLALQWSGERGALALDSAGLDLAIPTLFADPLWADRLHAKIGIETSPAGWGVEIDLLQLENEDAAIEGRGSIELGEAPHVDLGLEILRADGGRVSRYLPVRKLPANTYRWLADSIQAGTITGGSMVFRGNPADFPFDDGEGLFHLQASIEDGILEYRPGWPEARGLSGTLIFHNAGFRAEQASGQILDSAVSDTEVIISNMLRQPKVEIRGQTRGSLGDLKAYVERAGIAGNLGPYLAGVEPGGVGELDLALAIPLQRGSGEPVRVSGQLRVRDGGLELPKSGIHLGAIDGVVRFDPVSGVRGRGITAQLHGERIELDFRRDAAGQRTLVEARGRQPFAPWTGDRTKLLESVRGTAHWDAEIVVDARGDSRLELFSDLEGVQLDWPAPLAKTTGTRRPLRIVWPLAQVRESRGLVDFDDVFAASVRLAPGQGQDPGTLRAAAVALGHHRPAVPPLPERGIDLRARLESADVDAWQRLLQSLGPADGPSGAAEGLQPFRAEIEVVEGLRWRGHALPGLMARLEPTGHGMQLAFDSDWLQGQAWSVPDEPSAEPGLGRWHVHLDRLHIDTWAGAAGARANVSAAAPGDPRAWPGVDLRVADLRLERLRLADVEVDLKPGDDGLEIGRLRAVSPTEGVALDGSGSWRVMPDGATESRVVAEVSGSDWGQGLGSMGISSALEQGQGSGRLSLSWPGAPYAPDIARLQGRVEIDVTQGSLREVEPGAGRLLGLVSLDLVPRRLRLDFRDVYTQGLVFDRMSGEALLDGGDLFLPELQIQSPSALVRVSGRTGLVARDFDQSIVVVPRLRSTLPIVGALLGGPVTGVVVLLVERVLGIGDQVEEAARVEYFVTGPWSDPEVKARVRAEQGSAD